MFSTHPGSLVRLHARSRRRAFAVDLGRKLAVTSVLAPSSLLGVDNRGGKQRNHQLVVADERIAAAGAGCRPRHDIGLRAVQADEIQIDRRQPSSAMPRLRASATAFRNTSGSTTADPQLRYTPCSEPRHVRHEIPEIAQAAFAERPSRRRRVHVDDVGADRDVNRDRNSRRAAAARMLLPRMGLAFGEEPADGLADAQAGARRRR